MSLFFLLAFLRTALADSLSMSEKMILRDCDRELKYYSRREMEENKITFHNGLLFYKKKLLTTRLPGMIYAFTRDFKIVVGVAQHDILHHSTLAGGQDVLCAGGIVATNGKLIAVNSLSGHYMPRREHLDYFVSYLEKMGVDVSEVIVKYYNGGKD
jgi:hypothetical protein